MIMALSRKQILANSRDLIDSIAKFIQCDHQQNGPGISKALRDPLDALVKKGQRFLELATYHQARLEGVIEDLPDYYPEEADDPLEEIDEKLASLRFPPIAAECDALLAIIPSIKAFFSYPKITLLERTWIGLATQLNSLDLFQSSPETEYGAFLLHYKVRLLEDSLRMQIVAIGGKAEEWQNNFRFISDELEESAYFWEWSWVRKISKQDRENLLAVRSSVDVLVKKSTKPHLWTFDSVHLGKELISKLDGWGDDNIIWHESNPGGKIPKFTGNRKAAQRALSQLQQVLPIAQKLRSELPY